MVINTVLLNSLNAFGDTLTSLLLSLLNAVVNVLLGFLLTGPILLNTRGVGIATLSANLVELIAAFFVFKRNYRFLSFRKSDFSFDGKLTWELLAMGLPLGFQWSILFIGSFFQASKVNLFGNGLATMATTAYSPYEGYLTMPISVIASAYMSFVGQNYGAKKLDRIKLGFKEAFLVEACAYVLVMGIGLLTAPYVAYIFLPSDQITPELTFYVTTYLYTISPCLILQAIIMMSRSAVQGMKKPLVPFFSGIGELFSRILICQFLPSLVSPNDATSDNAYKAICFSNPAAWLFSALFMGGFAFYFVFLKKRPEFKEKSMN
jgi:Na+-driven multidrug efflux pump